MSGDHDTIPYRPRRLATAEMVRRAGDLYSEMEGRRSVRSFSSDEVPQALVELAIRTASTAPSGANRQPWTFVAVSDPELKRRIRRAAEHEERENYEGGRLPEEWRRALRPLGTTSSKPYLETAPWLVALFEQRYGLDDEGRKQKNYYVKESVGIACGFFITALHHMGLATLPHTPSPMRFLGKILGRPKNEKPYILFPVGYPADDAQVPDLRRKSLDEVALWNPRGE
jgi:iodotyrosine deiodinase